MKNKLWIKLSVIFICFFFLISLTGCFGNEDTNDNNNSNTDNDSTTEIKPYEFVTENNDVINKTLYKFNGHYYYIYEEKVSWETAVDKCMQLGGHLVTINSQEEDAFIVELIKKFNCPYDDTYGFHLGGIKKNGVWGWHTGEAFEYTKWGRYEPSGNGNYLCIWNNDQEHSGGFNWDDQKGNIYYICEWENKLHIGKNGAYFAKQINNVAELKNISNSDGVFFLNTDIDLSNESNWTPISNFSGILSGEGHVIKNLSITSVNDENIGLFSELKGTVQDLTIENASVVTNGDAGKAGIVAGTNSGTIKNVIVDGYVEAKYYNYVGGIAGYSNNGVILNCENRAIILGNDNVGGIAGYICIDGNEKANNNINNAEVAGNANVGGVFGYLTSKTVKTDKNFTYEISSNENRNIIKGKNNVGGVIGYLIGASYYSSSWYGLGYFTISSFKNNGEVLATGDYVGGIVGFSDRLSEITTSENKADIKGSNYVGGYVGKAIGTTIKNANNTNNITGKGYVGGIAGYAGKIESATNDGEVISTAIIVEDTISRSYVGGIAGYCKGINDSKNSTNIIVLNAGSYVGGLVGYLCVNGNDQLNGNENLGQVKGADSVGGIVGYATMSTVKTDTNFNYTFSENTNNGTVSGTNDIGGIVGTLIGAGYYASNWYGLGYFDVSICKNNAIVSGTGDNVGGIIGNATRLATLTVCENNSDVTGNNYVGGYVGVAVNANIKLASNYNVITGKGYVGGIAGKAGKIENCTNNGIINSTGVIIENEINKSYVGGIVGYCKALLNSINYSNINVENAGQYVGGLAGYILFTSDNEVNTNENHGNVVGGSYTGGIAGYIASTTVKTDDNFTRAVSENKNYGSVNGVDNVGGIFGYVYGAGKYSSSWYGVCTIVVTYCENEGLITGSSYVGGIIGGYTRLNIDDNVFNTNTTLNGNKIGQ